jgi:signal peptidase I
MIPTVLVGDNVFANKFVYGLNLSAALISALHICYLYAVFSNSKG